MALDEWDPRRGRGGRRWRELVRRVCAPGAVCALCGGARGPILFGLRRNHPLGPSVDHIVELVDGGHPTALWNLQPAHFGCNSAKEAERRRRAAATRRRPRRSRDFPPVDRRGA